VAITGSPSATPEADTDRPAGPESSRFSPEADLDGGPTAPLQDLQVSPMTAALDDQANAARLLVGGLQVRLLPAPFCRGRAGTGQFPEPGHLGLQLAGLLLQDPADAGQVQPVGGQRADFLEPADVPAGVAAGAARAARRVQQPFSLVDPQRLRGAARPAPRPPRC
jgi:hypothetical protein